MLICGTVYRKNVLNNWLFVDWFYKLNLRCDNIETDCMVDRRLEKEYCYLKILKRSTNYAGKANIMTRKSYYKIIFILDNKKSVG